MASIDGLVKLAIEFRDKGELEYATKVFSKILKDYPNDKDLWKVYTLLGGVSRDLKQNLIAVKYFKMATKLNPDAELASLGSYVTLTSLDMHVDAIEEIKRFLSNHPARLYRDTLEELLDGLTKGFMSNYGDEIRAMARSNGFK